MEQVVLWEQPPLIKPEFRLYYDDSGKVICYTCEKLPGDNYIVVDAQTYAEARPDLRVVDGQLSTSIQGSIVAKLTEKNEGVKTASWDVSLIVNDTYTGPTKSWSIEAHAVG
jgi:hypothetical protein